MALPAQSESIPPASAAPHPKRGTKRIIVFVLVFIAAIAGVYLSPIRTWLADASKVRHAVESLGAWVYPVGIFGGGLLIGCGVPRLLICTVAGMTLGFWRGLLVGELSTVIGYYGVFLFIRWGGREWALHRWPKLNKWSSLIEGQGILGIILLRHVPIHGTLTNLGLGISNIKHRQFLIGTAIGIISEAIPATLVGTGLSKGSAKSLGMYLALAAVAFVIIWIGCAWGMKALKKRRGSAITATQAVLELDE